MPSFRVLVGTLSTSLLCLLLSACGDDGQVVGCRITSDCEAGETCVDSRCVPETDAGAIDSAVLDGGERDSGDAGEPPCTSDDQCGGGVCLAGACCASMDNVCGSSCCGDGEVCFGNACVMPGDTCTSAADCDEGAYCELGLGEGEPPDPMMACSSVVSGRCLALPPSCDDSAPGEACVRSDCEFRPEVGELDAVVQWRWDPETATSHTDRVDVWGTPVVGRIHDSNCDGTIDSLDPSAIIVVSNNTRSGACHSNDICRNGILRALDGATGRELWSLTNVEGSAGFSAVTPVLGDLDDNGVLDIALVTAEGRLAAIDGDGGVMGVGTDVLPYTTLAGLGWGGGLALGDMEGDGDPEVAWRGAVYTWSGGTFTERFNVAGVRGGWPQPTVSTSTSFFVDLDDDPALELLAGRTAIDTDGSILWQHPGSDGFAAVADFDEDGAPDVVFVASGTVTLLDGATGMVKVPAATLQGTGFGGPPTVADFDGDGAPEIGVAQANRYSMLEVDMGAGTISTAWSVLNHDNSSSVTGSTVFDFEGDGVAEVIYNDECFLWVFDGPTGEVRFTAPTASFTGTEASLVADVDGDGHAEMVMISTGADTNRWSCAQHTTGMDGYPVWNAPSYGPSWQGVTVFRDRANSWVGTRSLWTQHAYHVTNTCDGRDGACDPEGPYGAIPTRQRKNWTVPWLNNFRQNVQAEGIFDAPDAVVEVRVDCGVPTKLIATLRNQGPSPLPAGVEIAFFRRVGDEETQLGSAMTSTPTLPGRASEVELELMGEVSEDMRFVVRVVTDPDAPLFRECDASNNESDEAISRCLI